MRKTKFEINDTTFFALTVVRMLCVAALVAWAALRLFTLTYVPSGSMLPTLNIGELCFSSRLSADSEVERGDIVSFNPITSENKGLFVSNSQAPLTFIKRVVGLPGDTVAIKNGVLYINGQMQEEPYLPSTIVTDDFTAITVPDGQYFMMGDNRNASDDSRAIGCIPKENLEAKTLFHTNSLTGRFLKAAATKEASL